MRKEKSLTEPNPAHRRARDDAAGVELKVKWIYIHIYSCWLLGMSLVSLLLFCLWLVTCDSGGGPRTGRKERESIRGSAGASGAVVVVGVT